MERTPVIPENIPDFLIIKRECPRTPVIKGKLAKPISYLLGQKKVSSEEIQSSLSLNELDPEIDPLWDNAHNRMLYSSLAYFFTEMIRGPSEKPYCGKSLIGRHHLEWDEIVNNYDRFLIEAPRDHGKCATGSSLIVSTDGRRIPIKDWVGDDVIGYDEKNFDLRKAHSTPSVCVGKEPCLEIITRTGRKEVVAENHRFATISGWVFAKDLKIKDRIGCPKTLPISGTKPLRPGEAWLLGLIVGDGGITGPVIITIEDSDIVEKAKKICNSIDWYIKKINNSNFSYGISNKYKHKIGPRQWLKKHKLFEHGSYTKRVPEAIFTAPNEDVAEFMAGWVDADGNINQHDDGCIEIYTVSENLARDGLHLFTRLGIIAVLTEKKEKYKGEDHWSWRLIIRGNSIVRFADKIKLHSRKNYKLLEIAKKQKEKDEGGTIDLLPKRIIKWLYYGKDWIKRRGGPSFEKIYDLTRSKVLKIAKLQNNRRLFKLASSEILWDEVVSIKSVGKLPVYAIKVHELNSYVGEDIINHNSHYFSLAYPIWRAGWTHPGKLGYIFSATQELAQAFLAIIKDEIINNPRLSHLVPTSKDNGWSQREITLSTGSTIRARGMGTKVRGGHPYWIIVDDGLTDESIYSETIRNRVIDYFLSAIVNMVVPGGQLGVVGTPMHRADLNAHLKRTGKYYNKSYPAIDKDGRVLFPERYNRARLEDRKCELDSVARFAREFLCIPLSDESSLFPTMLFEGSDVRIPYVLGLPAEYWEDRGMIRFTGIDFAMSSSAKADWTVIFTIAVDKFGNKWIANIKIGQGWGFQKQLDEITEQNTLMKPDLIHAEANQMQRIFSDEIIRTTDLPIRKFFTSGVTPKMPSKKGMSSITANKHHLERGVPSIRISLENRKWRIPRGDRNSIELTDRWMGEFQSIGWENGKIVSVGEHDDFVMATWMADTAARSGGFKFCFGDEKDEQANENLAQNQSDQYDCNSDKDDEWKPKMGAPIATDFGVFDID